MNVLILGKGGRELAIQKALLSSSLVKKVFVAPGGDGFFKTPFLHRPIDLMDSTQTQKPLPKWGKCWPPGECLPSYPWEKKRAQEIIKTKNIGLTVIGPEKELSEGAGDFFRSLGVPVFGPSKESAKLESSKLFAKHFMFSAGVPTSEFEEVFSVESALKAGGHFGFPSVLKADGLAGGKGVFICPNKKALKEKAKSLFEDQILGLAGKRALIESFQTGWELSLFVLIHHPSSKGDQKAYQILPFAKDYKKLKDKNKGPNTGGMGAFAPYFISPTLKQTIEQKVVIPSVQAIQKKQLFYRGVLYIGLMIVDNKDPIVLEYNVRFGDPETQVLLPLLEGDWAKVFLSVAKGHKPVLRWKKDFFAGCVVLAGENYPDKTSSSLPITGDIEWESPDSYFLLAGVQKNKEGWVTKGGRILNAIGLGMSQKEAIERAYAQARHVHWPGLKNRLDIGS